VRLPASFQATQLARQAIQELPALDDHEDVSFVGQLLTTELVTNAVRHPDLDADTISLDVECSDGTLHVEVTDFGSGFNPLSAARQNGLRARHGLHLLDALADRWGYRCGEGMCRLWFDLDVVAGRRPWRGRVPIKHH